MKFKTKLFNIHDCPICAYVAELDRKSGRLKKRGKIAQSIQIKDRADRLRAKNINDSSK